MSSVEAICKCIPSLVLTSALTTACGIGPTRELQVSQRRAITIVTLSEFLRRNAPQTWPIVYVSDEYVGFSIDSALLKALPQSGTPFQVAWRSTVWVSTDIVRDGGLLLEPSSIEMQGSESVTQSLRFSSTSDFGGELLYTLEWVLNRWTVKEVRVIWIV